MYNGLHNRLARKLLQQIAKYASFVPELGLFNGKTGVAILLYHGSRYLKLPTLERIADELIDDIIEGSKQINSFGFTDGLSGIAWGINYLMSHSFIELENTFFDEIDSILFSEEIQLNFFGRLEYPMLGLYILSRYITSQDKCFWNYQANMYCNQIYELIQTSDNAKFFAYHKSSLAPLQYCLREWEKQKFPFLTQNNNVRQLKQYLRDTDLTGTNTIKNVLAKKFFYKPILNDKRTELKEILTVTDISILFFNKLLYNNMPLPSKELLYNSFSHILKNKLLRKELILQLNHRTIGLSHYISGFTWALLCYNQLRGSQ